MHASDLEPLIREFVVENFMFGADAGTLADDDSFIERGIIDSTGVLELVTFLEESFGIKLDDEELIPENLDSIRRVVLFVSGKLAFERGGAVAGR